MKLTMNDEAHHRVTEAANLIGKACVELEQAGYDNAVCDKLHTAACNLHRRVFRVWEKNVNERKRAQKARKA